MFIKSQKFCSECSNNVHNVHNLTICSEFRRNAKNFSCAFAQNTQKNYVIIAKKRKNCEFGIDILEKTLYNDYNHRNGVMGRSVFFFRSALCLPRKKYTS